METANAPNLVNLLIRMGVKIESVRLFERPDVDQVSEWAHDANHWQVRLSRYDSKTQRKRLLVCCYSIGSAHKGSPKPADVVFGLIMDADAGMLSFEEYCSDYGVSVDSLQAKRTWQACQKASVKIREFFGDDLKMVQEASREY